MKLFIAVLIAAVTLNCLVTVINGSRIVTDTLAVPYIDTLLPPFKDIQDNGKNASDKINVTAKDTTVSITTTSTTKQPITKNDNNILPELSIEALLPPLFEANVEKEDTTTIATTTTYRITTTTAKSRTSTKKPSTTTTTTLKPPNLKPNDLFLDSLLPPLFNNSSSIDAKEAKVTTIRPTTEKPITTTKKSYHQQQTKYLKQQEDNDTKNYAKQQQKLKHAQSHRAGSGAAKNYNNKITTTSERHVAESQTHQKHVFLTSQLENDKTEKTITQYVAKQAASNNNNNTNKHDKKQYNYNFESYFGSTTTRPPKSGLPTITPFPRNLGR